MNPAANADPDEILEEEREVVKLRLRCEGCGNALSVDPNERGKLDNLVRAHLTTAGERYGTPCSQETITEERVYTDGSTEGL
jgi:hypothetical protein